MFVAGKQPVGRRAEKERVWGSSGGGVRQRKVEEDGGEGRRKEEVGCRVGQCHWSDRARKDRKPQVCRMVGGKPGRKVGIQWEGGRAGKRSIGGAREPPGISIMLLTAVPFSSAPGSKCPDWMMWQLCTHCLPLPGGQVTPGGPSHLSSPTKCPGKHRISTPFSPERLSLLQEAPCLGLGMTGSLGPNQCTLYI